MNNRVIKHKNGSLYEVNYLVHAKNPQYSDVYACYKLSGYDGMPTGEQLYIPVHAFDEQDVTRVYPIVEHK